MKNLSAEILAVGTELLLGDILNTNAQFLSQELSSLGFNVYFETVVGDNPERLSAAVNLAINRADVVITSGGLGPTEDDLTKETVADALGLSLFEDEESKNLLCEYFKDRDAFPKSNLKQALIPEGGRAIKNDNGTAPGVIVTKGEKTVIMLPGPPKELIPMFNDRVRPILSEMTGATIVSKSLKVFGIGESQAAEMLKKYMDGLNPSLAPYAKTGELLLRITAKADTKKEAEEKIEPVKNEVIKILGDSVYAESDITLSECVTRLLIEKNITVATAESCTAGKLAAAITETDGASLIFKMGVVTYSNEAKESLLGVVHEALEKFGAVSQQIAKQMAEGIKEKSGADIGIGITGIAGPGGGTDEKPVGLVYVGVATKNGVYAKELRLKGNRERVRTLSVLNALDLIRREAKDM